MKCKSCNNEIDDDSVFCKHCGTRQTTESISEYVDLGLPSGTLWKKNNEDNTNDDHGFYTYLEAVRLFGDNMPTRGQFQELIDYCVWTWNAFRNGYDIKGRNDKFLFLPAAGFRDCNGGLNDVGSIGYFWSSTHHGSYNSWYLYFTSEGMDLYYDDRSNMQSVRLVKSPTTNN